MVTENTHQRPGAEDAQPVAVKPLVPIEVIRKRPDFLAANRGKRFVTPDFILLAHKRRTGHPVPSDTIRYGITVTKKIRSEEHTSELQSRPHLVCRLLLE